VTSTITIDPGDGAPELTGEPLKRPTVPALFGSFIEIIVPFLGLQLVPMWGPPDSTPRASTWPRSPMDAGDSSIESNV